MATPSALNLALLSAGLGMLGSSGPRPFRQGPPTMGGALSAGGMAGLNTFLTAQQLEEQRQRAEAAAALAQQRMGLEERRTAATETQANAAAERARLAGIPKPARAPEPKLEKGADGRLYWFTSPEKAAVPALPNVKPAVEEAGTSLFPGVDGKTETERAYAYLLHAKAKQEQGALLTGEEIRRVQAAISILDQPRTYVDQKSGTLTTVRPDLPEWTSGVGTPPAPIVPPGLVPQAGVAPSGGRITREKLPGGGQETASVRTGAQGALQSLEKIGALLATDDAGASMVPGTAATGVEGALRRNLGGYARQLGIPVESGRAKALVAEVERLKMNLTPVLTQERTRFSTDDRLRVDRVLGDLANPGTDSEEIRETMVRVLDTLRDLDVNYQLGLGLAQ